jgi:hypothetical protein
VLRAPIARVVWPRISHHFTDPSGQQLIASTCAASVLPAPSFRLIEAPEGTSSCLRPMLNRKGDPAGTGLNPEVSVNVRLVIALGDDSEVPPAPPRRSAWAFADVASANAPAAPVVSSSRRRVILTLTTRASVKLRQSSPWLPPSLVK